MSQMSNYLENALINGVLRNTTYSATPTVYVALYTTDPTDSDVGVECTLGAYVRKAVTFAAPSNGVALNSADVSFPAVTSGTETITHIGIRDKLTTGNLLFYAPLIIPRTLTTNNQMVFLTGQISVALS